ncbi:hypothetical protein [Maricaulis sp. MIT060901]|uniref:hypothetical protein n=1 Tax=Maricaulis sp. MIT060901 TaxID=3096993 RepID=UPI00399B58F4
MSSYFYAAQDAATLSAALSAAFVTDEETGAVRPVSPKVCLSTSGVWLQEPVMSEPDENGEQTVETEGVRSEPYVVLSPTPIAAWAAFQIVPVGVQGFA